MSIPTYEYTTLKKILGKVKLDLRLESAAEDIYLINYITRLAPEMMTATDFVELTETIEICDDKAKLPCGFVRFDRPHPLKFTTNGQANCNNYFNWFDVVYTGGAFVTCNPKSGCDVRWGVPSVQVQDGYIYFSNNIGATECTISYLSVLLDVNGDCKIPLTNERPIIEGVKWMYKMDLGEPQAKWITHRQVWYNGKQDRRGLANIPDSFEQERLAWTFNSMFGGVGVS